MAEYNHLHAVKGRHNERRRSRQKGVRSGSHNIIQLALEPQKSNGVRGSGSSSFLSN